MSKSNDKLRNDIRASVLKASDEEYMLTDAQIDAVIAVFNNRAADLLDRLGEKVEKYRNQKGENRYVVTLKTLEQEKRRYL